MQGVRARWSLIGGFVLAVVLWSAPSPALAEVPGFEPEDLPVAGKELFDLGVADVDDDTDLDLFTTNHLSPQSLLVNDGSGLFTERVYQFGLAHTREFPGWEEAAGAGADPGLHLYHRRSALHLRMVGEGTARGSVSFLLPTRAGSRGPAHAVVRHRPRPGPDAYVAAFRLGPDSRVRLDPSRMAQPFTVRIEEPFPLDQTFVGASPNHPSDRRFVLQLRDRHAMAWADIGGDSSTDVFVVRGGLQGDLSDLVGEIEDELLIGRDGGLDPVPRKRAPRKGACRGRAAGAVDFSGDGRLDLFATCRGSEARLYRRTETGFARYPRGQLDAEAMRWLDLDGDTELEALGAYASNFAVFDTRRGLLREIQSVPGRQRRLKGTAFAVADYDNDGDQDVYASAATGSTLLRWAGGRLRSTRPGAAGLPGSALAAAWCDYDNDGLQDLLTVPGGLFRQSAPGTFEPLGELPAVEAPREARLSCADLDSNGARDAVVAARSKETRRDWKTVAYLGDDPTSHWLEVVLAGPSGNRQAIGARVSVRSGGQTQTQWVGQNETSLYSQGHYRLYFGLGLQTSANLTVRWPDGKVARLPDVAADQLLPVER